MSGLTRERIEELRRAVVATHIYPAGSEHMTRAELLALLDAALDLARMLAALDALRSEVYEIERKLDETITERDEYQNALADARGLLEQIDQMTRGRPGLASVTALLARAAASAPNRRTPEPLLTPVSPLRRRAANEEASTHRARATRLAPPGVLR